MTEEGVVDLSDYHLEFKSDKPVRAGLITATTQTSYGEFRRQWKGTGFLSRLLPFSFSHSVETTKTIMDNIDARLSDPIEKVKFKVVRKPKSVLCPEHMLRQLRLYKKILSNDTGSQPYRHQIQLNSITEALAVLLRKREVNQEDIDKIAELSNWINYDFKEL
jgi:hypothetical protein